MGSSWKALIEAGLPDGAARPAPASLDRERVREAICDLARGAEAIDPRQVEPLLAWLRGWRHHWPRGFAETLGAEGDSLIQQLEARNPDPNRYIKLRRIAVENLSRLL
ncbi:MAG: hypothetical protein ACRELA_02585 [Candidatus Rokuibacteriota bacterium]